MVQARLLHCIKQVLPICNGSQNCLQDGRNDSRPPRSTYDEARATSNVSTSTFRNASTENFVQSCRLASTCWTPSIVPRHLVYIPKSVEGGQGYLKSTISTSSFRNASTENFLQSYRLASTCWTPSIATTRLVYLSRCGEGGGWYEKPGEAAVSLLTLSVNFRSFLFCGIKRKIIIIIIL